MVIRARIAGGEERSIGVGLRTRSDDTVAAELDLLGAPLPKSAREQLENAKGSVPDAVGLRAVRTAFQRIDVHTNERVTFEGAPFAADPRQLLSSVEQFFWWLLEARGERRTDAPYR
jgi:hypothetical protein